MPVEKLQINKNFFNKLNSVYSKRKDTNTQSFGSSPVSVITEKPTTNHIKSFTIPDNTQPKHEKIQHEKIQHKSIKNIKSSSPKKQKEVLQIIEKKDTTIITNNSFHLYDDDYHTHLIAKLDKRNPLYNKLINLPFNEIVNISYKQESEKQKLIYCTIGLLCGLVIGLLAKYNYC
jgi:hypothetical protein